MIKFINIFKKNLFILIKYSKQIVLVFFLLISIFGFSIYFNPASLTDAIELKLYDLRVVIGMKMSDLLLDSSFFPFKDKLTTTFDKSIVVFAYNDELLQTLDKYPNLNISNWPPERSFWAGVLKYLRRSSNLVTAFDVRFAAPDKNPNNDKLFNKEIKKNGNIILGFSMLIPKEKAENQKELETNIETLYKNYAAINRISLKTINLIIQKFIVIPKENFFSNLDFNTKKNIAFAILQDLMPIYVKNTKDIGVVNVQMGFTNEVIRDNKPLYNYLLTDKFALSLPFATARYVLADYKKNKIEFQKNFITENLLFGSKVFPLNENGNVYIDWKGNSNSYNDISLLKSIAYEANETMDLKKGYYVTPDEQNFYWQSYFNYLLTDNLVDIYYQRLNSGFNNFFIKTLDIKFDINDGLKYYDMLSANTLALASYRGNLSGNDNITLGNRENNIFDILTNQRDYSLFNYLEDYNYSIKFFTYNYLSNSINIDTFYNGDYLNTFKNFAYSNSSCHPKFLSNKYNKRITQKLDIYFDLVKNHLPYYFLNKIILIGQTATGTDIHSVPFDNMFPGPKVMTTTIDSYLNNGNSSRKTILKLNLLFNALIILVLIYATIKLTIKRDNYFVGFFYFIVLLIIFLCINIFCFIIPFIKVWINMTYPVIFMFFAFLGSLSFKMNVLDKDKKQIKSAFGRFVSPQILDSILNNPEFLSSQVPKKRNITVMFSDIRNFTTYSEKMQPEDLVNQLNEYLSEMVEVIIMEHNGTFDKFMGDALMAFWGDPMTTDNNAKRAVLSALSMKEHLKLLNEKWKKEGKPPFRIGIGINTGEMIVGFSGSPRLRNYTVLGDNVNIASRIEGLNKQFGTEIIVSQSTYEEIKDIIECRFLGSVTVKGKMEEIKVYEVVDLKMDSNINFIKPNKLYIEMNEMK